MKQTQSSFMKPAAVILSAGRGRRMGGAVPKVLCELAGRPLLGHVFDALQPLQLQARHVVVGHAADQVRQAFSGESDIHWHQQQERLGTAHAVSCVLPSLADDAVVLVAYGDMPLIRSATFQALLNRLHHTGFAMLTAVVENPQSYGRILRAPDGDVTGIVEESDATPAEREIREVSTGVIAARAAVLRQLVADIDNNNRQGEYYLTDCVRLAAAAGLKPTALVLDDASEAAGVNSRRELEAAECLLRRRRVAALMEQGATVCDADRLNVRGEIALGRDVVFDVGVILEGKVELGDEVRVGAYSILKDVRIGAGTVVKPYSLMENAQIGARCSIGPYARVRPETVIGDEVRIGNFVEIKHSEIAAGSKINHLSYVGDSEVGRKVNIGAGVITCNYDGAEKHKTIIGDDVFVGSNTQIIAPVKVGDGATIGAGSTITRDAPPGELTLSRSEQKTIAGWKRPRKQEPG